jgi:hypothetical protein
MLKYAIAAVAAVGLLAGSAMAQAPKAEEKKELTEQQKRMQQCNADAKQQQFKDGAARQAFMSTCLKGGQPMTQQEKMTACNKEAGAKALKGDDRKAFMSKCLSG